MHELHVSLCWGAFWEYFVVAATGKTPPLAFLWVAGLGFGPGLALPCISFVHVLRAFGFLIYGLRLSALIAHPTPLIEFTILGGLLQLSNTFEVQVYTFHCAL